MSNIQKEIFGKKYSTPPLPASSKKPLGRNRDYSPLEWNIYFSQKLKIKTSNDNIFNVYILGDSGPLLLLLHGGGYSGLTWALFAKNITQLVECQIMAIDLRGHGETTTSDDNDLSADTLSRDVGEVVDAHFGDFPPPLVIVGHSMGGAIAVHTVSKGYVPTCIGLIVIDVVEGTALDALQSMQSFLKGRPKHFPSLDRAIEWCVRSGQVRNLESARVSMPGQLKLVDLNSSPPREDRISEEVNDQDDSLQDPSYCNLDKNYQTCKTSSYTWRINLSKTENYWEGWFSKLSTIFLDCNVPKILLLAGIDRLDRELTIGQMQGKFQMQVLPQSGHAVHEDVPEKVAEAISTFLVRHRFSKPLSDFKRVFPCC